MLAVPSRAAPGARTAVVTQATAFAGPAAVAALRAEGTAVLAQDRAFGERALREAFEQQHPGVVCSAAVDAAALLADALAAFGALDVLLSNDVHPAIHQPTETLSTSDLRDTLEQLVVAPFQRAQQFIPHFRARGRGSMIFITSCRTELPLAGGALPDMARAAANALVRSLAVELAPGGIAVNAIAPNYYASEAYFPRARFVDDPAGAAWIQSVVPAGRLGRADELGQLVCYLANLRGNFHTGSIIPFAGGWPAAPPRPEAS